jgi:hypothetical protein
MHIGDGVKISIIGDLLISKITFRVYQASEQCTPL